MRLQRGMHFRFDEKYSMTYNQTKDCALNTFRSLSAQVSSECKGELNDGFSELQRSASCPTPNTNNDYNDYDDFYELKRC